MPDLRKSHQVEFLQVLLHSVHRSLGFKSKALKRVLGKNWKTAKIAYELRKLRIRDTVEKIKSTHYYRLTKEGYIWIFYLFFNSNHMLKLLLYACYKNTVPQNQTTHQLLKGLMQI